jgi:hypothetical protein
VDLTLAVDEAAVEKAREVARQQGTSLDALLRDFIERLARKPIGAEIAARLRAHWDHDPPARSTAGGRFRREDVYDEGDSERGKRRGGD